MTEKTADVQDPRGAKKFKILSVSDEVVNTIYSPAAKERFGDVDLVLSCGDLPFYYLEFIVDILNVPLYYVYGNHDRRVEYTYRGGTRTFPGGCTNLDSRVIEHKGLLLGGLQGSMKYSPDARYQYTDLEMYLKVWGMTPSLLLNRLRKGRYLDILITHAPPYGIHDGRDLCHTGFKAFLWFIERYQPRYLLHGHLHLYGYRQKTASVYQGTQIINTVGYRTMEVEVPDVGP